MATKGSVKSKFVPTPEQRDEVSRMISIGSDTPENLADICVLLRPASPLSIEDCRRIFANDINRGKATARVRMRQNDFEEAATDPRRRQRWLSEQATEMIKKMKPNPGRRAMRRVLAAGRVLEIYATPGMGYADVVKEMGQPRDPITRKKMNAAQLIEWAVQAFLSDDAKERGAARLVGLLETIAHSDPTTIAKWGPDGVEVRSSDDLTADERRLVCEIVDDGAGKIKVKVADRLKAAELLRRHYGIGEKIELTGDVGVRATFIVEK